MWANHPVGLAVVEAIAMLGWSGESLRVLDLGCTTEPLNIGRGRSLALGLGYWGLKIIDYSTGQRFISLNAAYSPTTQFSR